MAYENPSKSSEHLLGRDLSTVVTVLGLIVTFLRTLQASEMKLDGVIFKLEL